jgi:hypothetical protein
MNRLLVLIICVALAGCGGSQAAQSDAAPPDSMTRGTRDSAIAHSRIPNAGAVGKAQGAAEAANARTAAFDSMQQQQQQ